MIAIPFQPYNPTPAERYELIRYSLLKSQRLEDFENIIELLSPPKEITKILPPGSCKGIRIGILGGGLAGLSAAYELRKLGYTITIFEAEENRIGGRVYTHYFDAEKRLYGELGPMRIPVSHETTWHYIDLFGLKTRPFIQTDENTLIYVMGTRVKNNPQEVQRYIYPFFDMTIEERHQEWPELEGQAFEEYLLKMPKEIRREILEIRESYSKEIVFADYFNIRQQMENAGLSMGAIKMLSSVNPFIGAFLYNSFFEILHEIYPVSFTFLYQIIGGMVNLPKAFMESLLSKCPRELHHKITEGDLGKINWRPGHQVIGISENQRNGSIEVAYKIRQGAITYNESFDFIVCAIPYSNLRLCNINPVFNSTKMEAIRMLNMAASQKTVLLCNYRFWQAGPPKEWILGGGSSTDEVISTIWYPSAGRESNKRLRGKNGLFQSPACQWSNTPKLNPNTPGVLTASYNWTQDAVRLGNYTEGLGFEVIKRQLEEIHGLPYGSLDSIVLDYKTLLWNNHPWSLGAFTFYTPQQKVDFSKAAIEPEYNNRLFFAGEHVSVARAWMQGALQTGMQAANRIATISSRFV